VSDDPGEHDNLAQDPDFAEVVAKYSTQIPTSLAPQGKGPKTKDLRVKFEGESFEWVEKPGKE
jgi:hypothetical protein